MFKTIQPNGPTNNIIVGRTVTVRLTANGNTMTNLITPVFTNAEVKVTFIGVNSTPMNHVIQHDTQLLQLPFLESNRMVGK